MAPYIAITPKCEICGGQRGRGFNHDKCSKIKQAMLKSKRNYPEPHLDKTSQNYLSKTGVIHDHS